MDLTKFCGLCQQEFTAKRSNARFCLPCRDIRQKEQINASAKAHHKATYVPKAIREFVCHECGTTFSTNHKQKYCSKDCLKVVQVRIQKELKQTPEYKVKQLQHVKEYTSKNKEKIKVRRSIRYYATLADSQEKSRQTYWDNVEHNRERQNKYKRDNRPKMKVHEQKRRALLAGSGGEYTTAEFEQVIKDQNNRCFDCLREFNSEVLIEVGHLHPISRGGSNCISNIKAQCRACNGHQATRIHPLIALDFYNSLLDNTQEL